MFNQIKRSWKHFKDAIHFKQVKTIDGEGAIDTDKIHVKSWVKVVAISIGLIVFLLLLYVFSSIKVFLLAMKKVVQKEIIFESVPNFLNNHHFFKLSSIIRNPLSFGITFLVITVATFIAFYSYQKISYRFKEIAYGQKGDSRLATLKEIQEQYIEIPDRKATFKGVGGMPITHYRAYYYIDTHTSNSVVIGISRSGKDEMYIIPLVDNLSRASIQSSMIINDPKGETFVASKETLEKRGYEVYLLNIRDPLFSMSYNPLQLIVNAWKKGDIATAQMLVNTLTYALYYKADAGMNKWVNEAAQKAVSGMILAVLEECSKKNEYEKVTMYNVGQMLNEMATDTWVENKVEKNALDEYFKNLPQGSLAKTQYGSTSLAGDRAKGTILFTVNEGLAIFQYESIAKMTSKNSFDMKTVGFPKYLDVHFDKSMLNKRVKVKFSHQDRIIGVEMIRPNERGIVTLNFDYSLETGDTITIEFKEGEQIKEVVFQVQFEINEKGEKNKHPNLTEIRQNFPECRSLYIHYSEKPIAIFMLTPDYDQSMHVIPSIFVKQLYTELSQQASKTRGAKTHRRVHFILNEFGNMPAIQGMDKILTVCLGRNILFDLAVQSYSQFFSLYGKENGETIKENCQNHIYIMSGNEKTIEEISKKVGHKTVVSVSSSERSMDMSNSKNLSADKIRILPPEKVSSLIEGETIVIRNVHRQDNKRNKIRPFPIFNTTETKMPYRWQFLAEDFDTERDINDYDLSSTHTYLNLEDLAIDFKEWTYSINNYDITDESLIEDDSGNNVFQLLQDYTNFEQAQLILDAFSIGEPQGIAEMNKYIIDEEGRKEILKQVNS